VATDPGDTLTTREKLDRPRAEVKSAIPDPFFQSISAHFDEGNASELLLSKLPYFGGADVHLSSDAVPSSLVENFSSTPASPEFDLTFLEPYWAELEACLQTCLVPSLGTLLPEAAGDEAATARAAEVVQRLAQPMIDTASAQLTQRFDRIARMHLFSTRDVDDLNAARPQ
jgi:hypothetical protein